MRAAKLPSPTAPVAASRVSNGVWARSGSEVWVPRRSCTLPAVIRRAEAPVLLNWMKANTRLFPAASVVVSESKSPKLVGTATDPPSLDAESVVGTSSWYVTYQQPAEFAASQGVAPAP